jgi:hypothetical protein
MSAIVILAPTASAAWPAATETAIVCFGPRLIHVERTPAEVFAVQGLDGLFRLTAVIHFHKAKTARPPGLAIRDYGYALNGAIGREKRLQVCFCGAERKVADEKFHDPCSFAMFEV